MLSVFSSDIAPSKIFAYIDMHSPLHTIMKNIFLAILVLSPATLVAQSDTYSAAGVIPSIKYSWKAPQQEIGKNLLGTILFEGSTIDMEFFEMMACGLQPAEKYTALQVPAAEEHLIMVKAGRLDISFRDSSWSIGRGSIAILLPSEKYRVRNASEEPTLYYLMKYRSRSAADPARGEAGGGSFVKDWNRLAFREHDRGGVRPYFEKATTMSKRFEMHVTTLNPGLKSHDPHRHHAEEIILLLDDGPDTKAKAVMQIGDSFFEGQAGDLYYVGSNLLHGIRNAGQTSCSYFAFQFE